MLSLAARLWNTAVEPSIGCTRNSGRSELCTELSLVKVGPSGFTSRMLRFSWACCWAGLLSLGVGAVSSVGKSRCQGGRGHTGPPAHMHTPQAAQACPAGTRWVWGHDPQGALRKGPDKP